MSEAALLRNVRSQHVACEIHCPDFRMFVRCCNCIIRKQMMQWKTRQKPARRKSRELLNSQLVSNFLHESTFIICICCSLCSKTHQKGKVDFWGVAYIYIYIIFIHPVYTGVKLPFIRAHESIMRGVHLRVAFDEWEETRRWTGGSLGTCGANGASLREMEKQWPLRCADSDGKGFFLGLNLDQSLIWKGSVIGVNV